MKLIAFLKSQGQTKEKARLQQERAEAFPSESTLSSRRYSKYIIAYR
jgi:hypothetical protein